MTGYTLNGQPVTEMQLDEWVREAEIGYDLDTLPAPRRGRPPLSSAPTTVVPVRLPADLLGALLERAEIEGLSRSEAVREAVKAWSHVA